MPPKKNENAKNCIKINEIFKNINSIKSAETLTATDTATSVEIFDSSTIENLNIEDDDDDDDDDETETILSNIDDDDPFVNKNPVFVSQKPCQPIISFPINNQNRKFSHLFYEKYKWLEYSIKNDSVHCFSCRYFDKTLKKTRNDTFINGSRDWKNLARNLDKHDLSERHKTTYGHYINRITNSQPISAKLSSIHEKEVALNRRNLSTIIEAVYYLANQGLAYRGHEENDVFKNNGNFLELLNFISKKDDELKKHLEKSNSKYICHKSQNGIIGLISGQLKKHIINSIDYFYSIIIDETMDIGKIEQVAFCVRYCNDNLEIFEKFLGFYSAITTTAEALTELILKLINSFKLNLKNLVGQGYDGAATMSGNKSGVATRIIKDHPNAIYVHCHNHKLNLALMDASTHFKDIRDTLHTTENLYAFVERSAKRHGQFQHIQDENKRITLKKYCQTRWSSHFDAIKAVVKTFVEIKTFLTVSKKLFKITCNLYEK